MTGGCTFLYIGQAFWLDWLERLDRAWQLHEVEGGGRDDAFLSNFYSNLENRRQINAGKVLLPAYS